MPIDVAAQKARIRQKTMAQQGGRDAFVPKLGEAGVREGIDAIPFLLSMLATGGEGGIPLMMLRAGLAGGGGEMASQGLRRDFGFPEPNPGIGGVARQAANQALATGVGGALSKGVGAAARPIMRMSLNTPKKVLQNVEAAGAEMPWDVALRMRTPISKTNLTGSAAMREGENAARAAVDRAASGSPMTLDPNEILARVEKQMNDMIDKPLSEAERAEMGRLSQQFIRENSTTAGARKLTASNALRMRRFADQITRRMRNATAREADIATVDARQTFARLLGDEIRARLDEIPGMAPALKEHSAMIGARSAMRNAEMTPAPPPTIMNPSSWPGISMAFNPEVGSRLALGLQSPTMSRFAGGLPRALEFAKEMPANQLKVKYRQAVIDNDQTSSDLYRRQLAAMGEFVR